MQQWSKNPAVRQGVIFGGLIILVDMIQDSIQFVVGGAGAVTNQGNSRGVPGLGTIVFLIGLGLLFLAGMFTARQNGKVDSASVAGFLAGVIGGLFGVVIAAVILATGPISTAGTSTDSQIPRSALIIGVIFGSIIVALVYAGLGAGLGAIGGLVGRSSYQSRNPASSHQESMYQDLQQSGAYPPPSEKQYPLYPPRQQFPLPPPGPQQ